jgi:hypothetical protein
LWKLWERLSSREKSIARGSRLESRSHKKKPFSLKGQGHTRLQPRDARRQLEQRRPELPVGQAQQQRARQPQQQRWLSPLQLTATVRRGVFTDASPAPTP